MSHSGRDAARVQREVKPVTDDTWRESFVHSRATGGSAQYKDIVASLSTGAESSFWSSHRTSSVMSGLRRKSTGLSCTVAPSSPVRLIGRLLRSSILGYRRQRRSQISQQCMTDNVGLWPSSGVRVTPHPEGVAPVRPEFAPSLEHDARTIGGNERRHGSRSREPKRALNWCNSRIAIAAEPAASLARPGRMRWPRKAVTALLLFARTS